jgi:hypothetical protein
MHIKFLNAAVHIDAAPNKQPTVGKCENRSQAASAPCMTLWSDRPFVVSRGRLIGVRKTALLIEVALIVDGTTSLTWLPANSLLTQSQINRWLSSCSFRTK